MVTQNGGKNYRLRGRKRDGQHLMDVSPGRETRKRENVMEIFFPFFFCLNFVFYLSFTN